VVASAITKGTFRSRASVCAAGLQALVVVVYRDREDLLRLHLADDVLVEDVADLVRAGQVALRRLRRRVGSDLLADDVVAEVDALVADEYRRARDEFPHLVLALAAERAVQELLAADFFGHGNPRKALRPPTARGS
jgi:hypothetical protein